MPLLIVAGRKKARWDSHSLLSSCPFIKLSFDVRLRGPRRSRRLSSIRRTKHSSTGRIDWWSLTAEITYAWAGRNKTAGTRAVGNIISTLRALLGTEWGGRWRARGGGRAARRATWPAIPLVLASAEIRPFGETPAWKFTRGNIHTGHDATLPTSFLSIPYEKSILSREIISKNYTNIYYIYEYSINWMPIYIFRLEKRYRVETIIFYIFKKSKD